MNMKINIVEYYFGFFGISAIVTKSDGNEQYFAGAFNGVLGEDRKRLIKKFIKEVEKYTSDKEFDQYIAINIRGNTTL
mgnify:CR=1 FL=1